MSFKKLVCLCLMVVAGSFGALSAPSAMAQGHGIASAPGLTEADLKEVKDLVKVSLLPALMTMQQAITVVSYDPEEACRLAKVTEVKMVDLRRGLVAVRDRVKSEGKDPSQVDTLIMKTDDMMSGNKRPTTIFCNTNLKPEKLSPEDRAMLNKVTGYISESTQLMISGMQAMLDDNAPQACNYLIQSRAKLLELDQYIIGLRAAKQAANQDVSQYDHLLVTNANNRQQLERLISQTCPAQ